MCDYGDIRSTSTDRLTRSYLLPIGCFTYSKLPRSDTARAIGIIVIYDQLYMTSSTISPPHPWLRGPEIFHDQPRFLHSLSSVFLEARITAHPHTHTGWTPYAQKTFLRRSSHQYHLLIKILARAHNHSHSHTARFRSQAQ
jgi:hypothetical protein